MENIKISLTELEQGEDGEVVELTGGHNFRRKLDALGIRPGKKITKISNMVMNGPVTVKINNTSRVAIGKGMADRILVKVSS